MPNKTFVLDTNVLIHDPESIKKFGANEVVVPLQVLEELDRLKRFQDDVGRSARAAIRLIVSLKDLGEGNFHDGIKLSSGGVVKIFLSHPGSIHKEVLEGSSMDNKIIMTAYNLKDAGRVVVFVSKDLAARIKAEAIGIEAEDYEKLKSSYELLYKGIREVTVEKSVVDHFVKDGKIVLQGDSFSANEYCVMNAPPNSMAVGRFDATMECLVPLAPAPSIWGVTPRNVEQQCAMDLLLRDDIKLVTLVGPAGTGKTLLALACAMQKVFDEGAYNRILVSRPIVPLGKDIGYLPGTKEEKLTPWMQPIYDNLEYLCESTGDHGSETLRWVTDSKKLEMEAVTYIRGRSLPKMFIIVDEAQNLTPHEVRTIVSRAGEGTKVVLAGDPTQIDNPYLDKDSNGLVYTVGKFEDHRVYGHAFLEKTERSELAALAIDLL